MKKVLVVLTVSIFATAFSVYAQVPPAPVPPAPYYNEVYTISDCLNAYDGTTCIITGTITSYDDSYHRDRYILKDNTGEISVRLSHHVIGNHGNVVGSSFKVTGELRGANHHPNYHKPKRHHADDPHIAARYIEKQ